MANIQPEITAFKTAVYGEDVRDAMVSLANKLNNEASSVSGFESRISNVEGSIALVNTEIRDIHQQDTRQDNDITANGMAIASCQNEIDKINDFTMLSVNSRFKSGDSATADILDSAFPLWNTVDDGSPLKLVNDYGQTIIDFGYIAENPLESYSLGPGFALSDDDGGIIFEISNGRQNTLCGKTISFIGDSITTYKNWVPEGYPYYYPKGDIQSAHDTWWKQLVDQTGMRLIQNCSWSGSKVTGDSSSTESASAACSTARINDVSGPNNEAPDFVVILISTNDYAGNAPLGEWDPGKTVPQDGVMSNITDAYMIMLDKLHKAYPLAKIFCCTMVPRVRTAGENTYPVKRSSDGLTIHELNDRIRDIATAMNCEIIDFETCGISIYNQVEYMVDSRLHPNAAGADILTQTARMALERYNTKVV